ncbi:DNA-protecting protein DprA [Microbacteriaceae bacterium K1510]|nr:DNA-protecting protein DprA [Microbacteriaceae bacterium K1510]
MTVALSELLRMSGRSELETKQLDMLRRGETTSAKDINIFAAGALEVLKAPCVAIVGTREVSEQGRNRAEWLAKKLAEAGVTVVSGLAKGVDTAAHTGALAAGGKTVAVIGTPLNKAYPIENAPLQEAIYRDHLLLSPFAVGEGVFKSNFPARNRVMAALTDATVIIEASDTSGTLHQAAECTRLKRWLFISKAIVDDPDVKWPGKFLSTYDRAVVLNRVSEIMDRVAR